MSVRKTVRKKLINVAKYLQIFKKIKMGLKTKIAKNVEKSWKSEKCCKRRNILQNVEKPCKSFKMLKNRAKVENVVNVEKSSLSGEMLKWNQKDFVNVGKFEKLDKSWKGR